MQDNSGGNKMTIGEKIEFALVVLLGFAGMVVMLCCAQ